MAATEHETTPIPSNVSQEVAEAKVRAEEEKLHAEAEAARASARKANAEADTAEHVAVEAQIKREKAQRSYDEDKADDSHHHLYRFNTPVSDSSATTCTKQLTAWHRLDPGCGITLVFNSPGGSVIAGMALFDFLRGLSEEGHHITTVTQGYAASMAGILLQAGDTRVMGRESYVLIHEVSAGAVGKVGELDDELKFIRKICTRVVQIFVERSRACNPAKPLTERFFKSSWERQDWWLDSEECLRYGIVDEVH